MNSEYEHNGNRAETNLGQPRRADQLDSYKGPQKPGFCGIRDLPYPYP